MTLAIMLISSYLVGSILIGDIVAAIKKVDLRGQGSGSVGATNVYRAMGPVFAAIVLLGDALKGVVAVLIGYFFGAHRVDIMILTGIASIIGHNWSVFAKFRGGKGMATTLGVTAALMPYGLIGAIPVWVGVFLASGYVSLASIVTALLFPLAVYIPYPGDMYRLIFAMVGMIFAVYRHRSNIQRLLKGEEHRILYSKTKQGDKK